MWKKLLTLDDLAEFCKKNKFSHFSANEAGGPLIVHTPAQFEATDVSKNGLLPVKLQACHTGLNRNKSKISEESMAAALPSFSNRPILGYIHRLDDGTWDFYAHNMELEEKEDGDVNVNYLEVPVGIIPESCNAQIVYDDLKEKSYVNVNGYIFEEYTKAADILRAKGTAKVSVELAIEDMSWNSDEDCLNINSFYFMGVTILGRDDEGTIIEEGMAGSNITLGSFSQEQNSVMPENLQSKMVETLSKLNDVLDRFNDTTNSEEKGGNDTMDKFNELLDLYGLTEDEVDFEVEGLSNEELEAAFTEAFGDAEEFKKKRKCSSEDDDDSEEDYAGCGKKKKKCSDDDESEEDYAGCKKKKKCSDDEEDDDESDDEDFAGCGKKKKRCAVNAESNTIEFELSHDDIRMALYSLINANIDDDSYAWICEVYDDHFIYQKETYSDNGYDSKYYKQNYSKTDEDVSLSGDPVEVFTEFVTESEKTALDMIRSQYEELKAFKDQYDAEQLKAQREEILESAEYAEIKDTDEFKALVAESDKYSVDELKVKADLLFADAMKKKFNFAAQPEKKHSVGINFNAKPSKKSTYGNLFADK